MFDVTTDNIVISGIFTITSPCDDGSMMIVLPKNRAFQLYQELRTALGADQPQDGKIVGGMTLPGH